MSTHPHPSVEVLAAPVKAAYNDLCAKHYPGKAALNVLPDDLFLCGQTLLETDKELGQRIDSHGLAKQSIPSQIESLVQLLSNGIDSRKGFFTAPLAIPDELAAGLGSALGTAGGTCYKDGAFIVISDPGKKLSGDAKDGHGIKAVLINPAVGDLKPALEQAFPHMQFMTYDKINDYLFSIGAMDETTRQQCNARIADGMKTVAADIPALAAAATSSQQDPVKALAQYSWVVGSYNGTNGKMQNMMVTGTVEEMKTVETILIAAGLQKDRGFLNNTGRRIVVTGSEAQDLIGRVAKQMDSSRHPS